MDEGLQIVPAQTNAGVEAAAGSRPIVNKRTGDIMVQTSRGIRVHSALRKDEWESLDAAIVQAARNRLNAIQHLRDRGLTKNEGSLGVILSQWNTVSELTEADVNISGRSRTEQDRLDFGLTGVPLPVISKMYTIGQRELEASRRMGSGIDTSHATAAARVVAERLERMLISGESDVVFNGQTIHGYTSHPDRNTDTATNYGGGDWGTIGNIVPTVAGMINAANLNGYYGPFFLYAAQTQYNEASNVFFTDGSGDTPADRIRRLANLQEFHPSDWLTAGELVLVQMTSDVVDIAQVPGFELTNLEWTSGDGMVGFWKVVTVAVPRIKSDYSGNSGVVHATGA